MKIQCWHLLELSPAHQILFGAQPCIHILFPSPKVNFHRRCIFSENFDPTLSQIGRHAVRPHFTKSCSFTLAHFAHFTSEYSSISSLSSDDWAELGGIVRRHVDPKKALQQVQKKISPHFQSSSITPPVFLLRVGNILNPQCFRWTWSWNTTRAQNWV